MTEAFLFHIILRTGLKKWELILELKINCTWNSQGDTDQTTTLLILRRFSELTVLLCPLPLPIHPWSSPLKALALEVVLVVKNPPANTGDATDAGSIPGLGRYPGKRKWQLLQYSCQEELMDRGTWEATVQGVTKSQTWLNVWAHTSCLNMNNRFVSVWQADSPAPSCLSTVVISVPCLRIQQRGNLLPPVVGGRLPVKKQVLASGSSARTHWKDAI